MLNLPRNLNWETFLKKKSTFIWSKCQLLGCCGGQTGLVAAQEAFVVGQMAVKLIGQTNVSGQTGLVAGQMAVVAGQTDLVAGQEAFFFPILLMLLAKKLLLLVTKIMLLLLLLKKLMFTA